MLVKFILPSRLNADCGVKKINSYDMALSSKLYFKRILIVTGLVLMVCLPILYLAGSPYLRDRRIARAHVQIQVGDSKEKVISLMGEPDRIEKCNDGDMWGLTPEQRKFKEQMRRG